MGGSGGGGFFPPKPDIEKIKDELDRSIDRTKSAEMNVEVGRLLDDLLVDFNDRKVEKINERLDVLKQGLEQDLEGSLDMSFGGSIQKRTFIDGLSDIDSLLILNKSELRDSTPGHIRKYLFDKLNGLKRSIPDISEITLGDLAVTVDYADGMSIQLLPALKVGDSLKISSSNGRDWSRINPRGFTSKLTKLNNDLNGKLVPTIKLIKAINSQFPAERQMTGYHVESLAVEAFKDYRGERIPKAMLEHFFNEAREKVKVPIRDNTGQSVHTDDYLGPLNSEGRRRVSQQLDIVARKTKVANNSASVNLWKEIFGNL